MAKITGLVWSAAKAYFFRGSEYVRYDVETDKADPGYPQPIASGWAGVFDTDIDAAVVWPNGKAYFFRGSEYVRYDVAADAADAGYPQPIRSGWAGVFDDDGTTDGDGTTTTFGFQLRPGESIGDRIVRCCEEALGPGPIGEHERPEFYRVFISCGQERTPQDAARLATVRTSCALFVRAVRQWCGAAPVGPYVIGSPMFKSMGNVSFAHPAFVAHDGSASPNPGDYFYISTTQTSVDGHTGIFLEETSAGTWRTAEGGGGDGTRCRLNERTFAGDRFGGEGRRLWGWFDCTKVDLPFT
jgi:Hemopexin